jgi:hypothetical protein
MLHGLGEFTLDESTQQLRIERGKAGVLVDYLSDGPLSLRQWTGYEPAPDMRYLTSIGRADGIPPQWHIEAATRQVSNRAWTVIVMRPYRKGEAARGRVTAERTPAGMMLRVPGTQVSVELRRDGSPFAVARKGDRQWRVGAAKQ